MFFIRRPTAAAIDRFLHDSTNLPLSYGPVGRVKDDDTSLDEEVVVVGQGRRDFEAARDALLAWRQFDIGWARAFPRGAPVAVGTVGAPGEGRFGFAYGTLTNHAESGEELFEVFLDPPTDQVRYRIRATSRPQVMLASIGHPIVRLLQARFRRDSAAAMRQAVHTAGPLE
jgi:uncharacterized protein (UPF0548 family)